MKNETEKVEEQASQLVEITEHGEVKEVVKEVEEKIEVKEKEEVPQNAVNLKVNATD